MYIYPNNFAPCKRGLINVESYFLLCVSKKTHRSVK